ncbi:unnamed protein product [Rotaria sordida]|uniref:ESF1-like protein n=1 Tax=Rotaria sordida TaxID=392033 RepID=A0A813NNK1_9BILA|nr:unnamed protein product [Rotaria sordida]CAF3543721.1 unnamed protein product [Rotaria sordida]
MDEIKKDTRFAHITKDPRFRPVSKNERKLKIDRRFASMFNDPKFKLKYTVDKRGRPLVKEHTTRDDMNKFYHLEQDDDDDDDSSSISSEEEIKKKTKKNKKSVNDEELDELLQSDESDSEEKDDNDNEEEEEEEERKSSSSEEDEEIPEIDDGIEWNEFDDKCARSDEVSHRLAVCNMDWDRVRAVDIFLLLNSWKSADGVIKSVTIYPSEYGLQQIEAEKKFGPLPGTTKPVITTDQNGTDSGHQSEAEEEPEEPEIKSDDDDDEPNFNQDDDPDTTDPIMRERLRKYQLNRLKYYYAVVECDSIATAVRIYEECDGLEYETSAVRLDLRFIPDSVTFDSSILPRDQCTKLPDKTLYKPILFRNTALTQTKVRCTWDETPIERRQLTKKKYTLEELDQVNLDAYLASESDEELQDDDNINDESDDENNKELDNEKKNDNNIFKVPTTIPENSNKKKQNQPIIRAPSILSSQDDIDRYRSLLLDFNDNPKMDKRSKKKLTNFFDEQNSDNEESNQHTDNDDDDASDIDMEITWQPGLKSKAEEKFKNSNNQKEKNKNKKHDKSNLVKDQIEQEQNDSIENDRETLELLTVDDDIDTKRDYNLRDMIKSHKQATKAATKNAKKLKKLQQNSSNLVETKTNHGDDFQLNLNDKRFQAVYIQPAFNIDQSDPHFKSTAGTQQLIDEKLKKRKFDNLTSSSRTEPDEDDIVVKLKRKSAKKD